MGAYAKIAEVTVERICGSDMPEVSEALEVLEARVFSMRVEPYIPHLLRVAPWVAKDE